MSAQQLPCLKLLEQQVEQEARLSGTLKPADHADLDTSEREKSDSPEQKQEEKQEEVRLNLPQEVALSVPKPVNIFAQRTPETKVNIFGNAKSVNLFTLSQQAQPQQGGLNIFAQAMAAPPSVAIPEDELSENSGSNRSHQELREPAEKVMRYEYEQQWARLGEWRVVKFRAGVGAVKEGVLVSLEREVNKPEKVLYLIVRSETTKVVLYHAFLLPAGKVEQFMGRKENLKLSVYHFRHQKAPQKQEEKADEGEKQEEKGEGEAKVERSAVKEMSPEREQVKLQFEKEEDASAFQQLVGEFSAPK